MRLLQSQQRTLCQTLMAIFQQPVVMSQIGSQMEKAVMLILAETVLATGRCPSFEWGNRVHSVACLPVAAELHSLL
jgi:hypothetical protein